MDFTDLPQLRQLQKDLWQWPRSRAAVMVGAGFSLNAEPLPGVTSRFPTWIELVRAMFDELHPVHGDETPEQVRDQETRFNRSNPLRIASEYEAAFDRRKLDLLIRAQNPDSDYQPGKLHSQLLQLPWADVFTTNYDTLLERTEIDGRNYQPVTKMSELTTAFAPRIVKLHGSFPSQTPFIISEEDYRLYPRSFAPFVNTVQQSLLENSFVLLGFSGEDPNFLAWTGWIRDELGGNHAPIYLVGPLSLGPADRSLLGRRGVIPIDLSPILERIPKPNGPHPAAIGWFLDSLSAGRKPRPEYWPEPRRTVSLYAGQPLVADRALIEPEGIGLSTRVPLSVESAVKAFRRWRFERETYPGWIVAPENKRAGLWVRTMNWFEPLVAVSKDWSPAERILLFREINWRLETIMAPSLTPLMQPFEAALDELFERLAQGVPAALSPKFMPTKQSWDAEVADAWLEIGFGLLRDARENYDTGRWNRLKTKLDRVVARHQRHSDRIHYEAALWAMWNLDRPSAKECLSRWQPSSRSPLAVMRKAALLAELDDVGEARSILRPALLEIRRALRNQGQNIELLSLEGWCTYLLFFVESARDVMRSQAVQDEFRERWQELKAWDCSPGPHVDYFGDVLSGPPPKAQKEVEEVRGFDPGRVSVSRHLGGDDLGPLLPGFACIRLYEQAGMPMRLPVVNVAGEALRNACRWVAPHIGFWSPALLIRAGKLEELTGGDFVSRVQLRAMDPVLARRLYLWCLTILERERALISGLIVLGSAQESALTVLPEVLSRLAFKVDAAELRRTFSVVLQLHREPGVRAHRRLHDSCEPWFLRLFEAAENELLLEWHPALIRAPLFDEGVQSGLPAESLWPDPMQNFPARRCQSFGEIRHDLVAEIHEATDWLLRRSASESSEGRRRAMERLIRIYHSRVMTPDQRKQLGDLLWGERGANNLPNLPNWSAWGFLLLPAPPGVDVRSVVKAYLLSLSPKGSLTRDANGRSSMAIGIRAQPLISEVWQASKPVVQLEEEPFGDVEWTPDEAMKLYGQAREWWMNDKEGINRFGAMGADPIVATAGLIGRFLARVVLPRMAGAEENVWQQLLLWIKDIRDNGVYPSVALPYFLLHRPAEAGVIAGTLASDLNSDVEAAVEAAANAVRHWVHLFAINPVPAPPPGLLSALIERVIFRRKTGINACVYQLARLLVERSDAITSSQVDLLSASLVSWHHATILPVPDGATGDFHEAERPDLRVLVGGLAGALKLWQRKSVPDQPEPPAITLWRESCASDPLPEIRRAFGVWDERHQQEVVAVATPVSSISQTAEGDNFSSLPTDSEPGTEL